MRILIVDDDADIRANLRRLLTMEFPASVVAEADGAAQAIPQIRATPPSMVLLDLTMPGGHGYALFKTIKAIWPKVPVILMTEGEPHSGYSLIAGQLPAAAYLDKTEAPERLAGIVRKVGPGRLGGGFAR
jgi:DNA-binding NarL/FixJ family response regulator